MSEGVSERVLSALRPAEPQNPEARLSEAMRLLAEAVCLALSVPDIRATVEKEAAPLATNKEAEAVSPANLPPRITAEAKPALRASGIERFKRGEPLSHEEVQAVPNEIRVEEFGRMIRRVSHK